MPGALAAYRSLDDSAHRAEFYRAWRAAASTNFTHPRALEMMGPRQSPVVEDARRWLLAGTGSGRGVADLANDGGRRFDEFERSLLVLGDETGRLEETLGLLAEYFSRKHRLMLWVKKQMAQPLFTGVAACFIAPIPLLVQGNARGYAIASVGSVLALLFGAGAIVLAVARRFERKPAIARARLARALFTAIEAGLPLGRAARLAADASANGEIGDFVGRQSELQLAGRSITASLAGCPHLTPEFMAILDTAERTGDFGAVKRLAELYEDGFK